MKKTVINNELFLVEFLEEEKTCIIHTKFNILSWERNHNFSATRLNKLLLELFFFTFKENPFKELVVDLKETRYIDDSGVTSLFRLGRKVKEHMGIEKKLKLRNVSREIEISLQLHNAYSEFIIEENTKNN